MKLIACFIVVLILGTGCLVQSGSAQQDRKRASDLAVLVSPTAPVLVYKTKKDYSNYVPIQLSEDQQEVTSYPDPKDLLEEEGYYRPLRLSGFYFLDRRGVSQYSVFTKYAYPEYAKLKTPPSEAELKANILDADPFVELYYCGQQSDFQNLEKELNKLIEEGGLAKKCQLIK